MQIDITSLLSLDCFPLFHSIAEGGQSAGRDTWHASLEQARQTPLLDTEEKLQAMRDFARSSGGWDGEEVAAWSPEEVNALFLQWIAGDCRELGADSLEDIDWEAAEVDQQAGRVSCNLYRGDDGRIYFYLGD